jgi:short subunit dehydrogenase-like uncharacterized protein
VTLVGKGSNAQGADVKVKGEVISDLDPGYAGTARMLAETAVCLAKDENLPDASGILTPSVAMGMPLVDRLRAKGMTFSAA